MPEWLVERLQAEASAWETAPSYITVYDGLPLATLLREAATALAAAESRQRELEAERNLERSRFASWAETIGDLRDEIERQPGEWGHLRYRIKATLGSAAKAFRGYAQGQSSPSNYRRRAEVAEALSAQQAERIKALIEAGQRERDRAQAIIHHVLAGGRVGWSMLLKDGAPDVEAIAAIPKQALTRKD